MSWIKLSETTYALEASPDPREIVDIEELQDEIDNLQTQIDDLEELAYPDGASDNLKQAVDMWNAEHYYIAYDNLVIEKDGLVKRLEEITNGS